MNADTLAKLATLPIRRSVKELTQLATEILRDDVWSPLGMDPRDALMTFPTYAMALPHMTKEQRGIILPVAIIGRHSTFDHRINGNPVFMECELWHHKDFEAALKIAYRMNEALLAVVEEVEREAPGDGLSTVQAG